MALYDPGTESTTAPAVVTVAEPDVFAVDVRDRHGHRRGMRLDQDTLAALHQQAGDALALHADVMSEPPWLVANVVSERDRETGARRLLPVVQVEEHHPAYAKSVRRMVFQAQPANSRPQMVYRAVSGLIDLGLYPSGEWHHHTDDRSWDWYASVVLTAYPDTEKEDE